MNAPLLFPSQYHEDDKEFIKKMLDHLDVHSKIVASEGYSSLWNKVHQKDIPVHKVNNVARKLCNTRLRDFVRQFENM